MTDELFDIIIEKTNTELPHIKHLTISGFGEFTADKSWRYKIEKGARSFKGVHVITNLSLPDFNGLEFLLHHISELRISVYGLSEEVYRNIHHPPVNVHYEEIRDKIVFLLERKKTGQRIILNYIEMPENRHQTEDWINTWKDKADLIEVWKPHNWIKGKAYRACCPHRIPTCGRPHKGPVQVQVDGTVNVCCFDYNGELLIGDLKKQSFHDIFFGPQMEKIQDLHRNGKADILSQCRVCDQRNCAECKSRQLLYSSKFNIKERINLTSTEYKKLSL